MDITVSQQPLPEIDADWLIIGLMANAEFGPAATIVDEAMSGRLSRLRERDDLAGKAGEIVIIPDAVGLAARQLCLVGLGDGDDVGMGAISHAMGTAALATSKKPDRSVACALPEASQLSIGEIAQAVTTSLIVGCVGPALYQAEPPRHAYPRITIAASPSAKMSPIEEGVEQGRIVGEAMNLTRELVNRPAGDIYPESFADRARQVATETGLDCEVLDESRLLQEKMGSLLAVAQGSDRPPRVVVLKHQGGGEGQPTIALIGKGVTFDSGGLSLKPSEGMKTMKADMAGAATVLGVMSAIAQMKLPVNVIGLMGLVENMVNGNSYKLGDVLTARNGVTIEVLNTDAEGRLVLADVLTYAVDQGAERMIDLATLTGSCVIALGEQFTGAFTNEQQWCDELFAAAKRAGEPIWQMPMDDSFGEQLKSDVADCKNIGTRWGGAVTAAKFLEKFVDDTPWVHLDIAGPAFAESANSHRDSGGTGVMVRTLIDLLTH